MIFQGFSDITGHAGTRLKTSSFELLSGRPLVRIQPGVPDFLSKALAARAFVFLPFLVFSCSILHAFSRLRSLFARGWAAAASNACSPRRFYPWSSFCSVSWERVNLSCRVVTDVLCTQIPLKRQRNGMVDKEFLVRHPFRALKINVTEEQLSEFSKYYPIQLNQPIPLSSTTP